jgi:hypothetical protein
MKCPKCDASTYESIGGTHICPNCGYGSSTVVQAPSKPREALRRSLFPLPFLFVGLMFVGMSILALGLQRGEPVLTIGGIVFTLITVVTAIGSIPSKILVWTLIGTLGGTLIGILLGVLVGRVAELLVGVIGGAVFGAIGGMVLLAVGVGNLGVPVLPGLKVIIIPRAVEKFLFALGGLLGAILGAIGLRETIIKVFGAMGGGAIAIGVLGMIAGSFVGARRTVGRKRQVRG